jgi:hypothetical protein
LNLNKAGQTVQSFVLGCMGCLGLVEAQDSNDEHFYGGVHFGEQNMWGIGHVDFSRYSTADELVEALGEKAVRHYLRGMLVGENIDLLDGAEILLLNSLEQDVATDLAKDEKWQYKEEMKEREEIAAELRAARKRSDELLAQAMDVHASILISQSSSLDCLEEKAILNRRRSTRLAKLRRRCEMDVEQRRWRTKRMADNRSAHHGGRKHLASDFDDHPCLFNRVRRK